jgi:hypothetical protein
MKLLLATLLVAVMLLYGCIGQEGKAGAEIGKAPGTDGSADGGAGIPPQGDTGTAFSELDSFAGADVNVTEPDAGLGDFSLNETQLG